MAYSAEQIEGFNSECRRLARQLQCLNLQGLVQSEAQANARAKEYLRHGVGRRLDVLRTALEQIFALFPPSQMQPLEHQTLAQVQLYLHAFVINLAGVLDNWAWAFVFRHELESAIGDRRNIGLFKKPTQRFLPAPLRDYVTSAEIEEWRRDYLANYRDSLAHRIPLYIPPAAMIDADTTRWQHLEQEKTTCIKNGQFDRLKPLSDEQEALGTAYPVFMHSFSPEEKSKAVYLHPQVLCDSLSIVELGQRFYASWHECNRV